MQTGIGNAVEDVRNEIARKDKYRAEDRDAEQQREIAAQSRQRHRAAESGIGKHRLREDRAAEQLIERRKLQGNRRQGDIAQSMPPYALPQRLAARLGKEHIVRAHHLEQLFPCLERDRGDARHAERERGQNQMPDLIRQRHLLMQFPNGRRKCEREPLQLNRKDHQKEQPEPKDRHGHAEQRKSLNCLIERTVAVHPR